jgi:hypothetical protein
MTISRASIRIRLHDRRATLTCCREARSRIRNIRSHEQLDAALEARIANGREDRGPYFMLWT